MYNVDYKQKQLINKCKVDASTDHKYHIISKKYIVDIKYDYEYRKATTNMIIRKHGP
jgi:hypothetical protein